MGSIPVFRLHTKGYVPSTHNTTGKDMKQDISPSFINDITINQLVNLLIKLWIAQFLVALFLGFIVMGASLFVLLITSLLGLGL